MAAVVRVSDVQDVRVPRAELLTRLRARQGVSLVPEHELVRDVLYLFQGMSGTHVRWRHEWQLPSDDGSRPAHMDMRLDFDEQHGMMAPPTRALIHRLAELGQLYERVQRYVDETQQTKASLHLAAQSLCYFLANELHAHCELVSAWDRTWHAQVEGDGGRPLTLQRLASCTHEPVMRMRLMSTIVASCEHAHGGALVSKIHTYTLTGHPFIRRYTAAMLDHVSRPFFHTLSRWLYYGELDDPFSEFFVRRATAPAQRPHVVDDLVVTSEQGVDAADVWHHRFVLSRMQAGDVLVGLRSSGLHSNGYSLVRKIVDKAGVSLSSPCPWPDATYATLGEALLAPTRVYVRALAHVLRGEHEVLGLAHITGGGFTENVVRMLPAHLGAAIDVSRWERPPLFAWLQREGHIAAQEMARTFNNGIGMVLVVPAAASERTVQALEAAGEAPVVLGEVTAQPGVAYVHLDEWHVA